MIVYKISKNEQLGYFDLIDWRRCWKLRYDTDWLVLYGFEGRLHDSDDVAKTSEIYWASNEERILWNG